jgi:hypothetical protein
VAVAVAVVMVLRQIMVEQPLLAVVMAAHPQPLAHLARQTLAVAVAVLVGKVFKVAQAAPA